MMIDAKYGSHLPILLRLVGLTDGPILELGMGGYSTPLLNLMCFKSKRKLVSCDNDAKWAVINQSTWQSDYHKVHVIKDNWDKLMELPGIKNTHFSIVFIDHRPAFQRRKDALRFKDLADFIIIHDSEPEIDRFYGYSKIYPKFKYVFHYDNLTPNTTVLSNLNDLSVLTDMK